MKTKPTHYQILEVSESASQELIDAAWKIKMRRFHPDGSEPNAEKAVRINQAHDILSNPEKRAAYNVELNTERLNRKPRPIRQEYPPPYPAAYPGVNLNADRLTETFIQNLDVKGALLQAGNAVIEQIAKDNPVIAELLRKTRRAG